MADTRNREDRGEGVGPSKRCYLASPGSLRKINQRAAVPALWTGHLPKT